MVFVVVVLLLFVFELVFVVVSKCKFSYKE